MTKRQTPGQRLKAYITEQGITQREMAARLDITDAHISDLINRGVTPSLALAVRIEDLTGIPARDFAECA